jgi:addiction module HigA family antidote
MHTRYPCMILSMATRSTRRAGEAIPGPGPDWLQKIRRAPPHPGSVFRELYRQHGTDEEISQAECARRMGISINRLNEIEREKRGLSPETAVLLSALTGVTAEFWYQLQANHDLWQAMQSMRSRAKKIKRIYPPKSPSRPREQATVRRLLHSTG